MQQDKRLTLAVLAGLAILVVAAFGYASAQENESEADSTTDATDGDVAEESPVAHEQKRGGKACDDPVEESEAEPAAA